MPTEHYVSIATAKIGNGNVNTLNDALVGGALNGSRTYSPYALDANVHRMELKALQGINYAKRNAPELLVRSVMSTWENNQDLVDGIEDIFNLHNSGRTIVVESSEFVNDTAVGKAAVIVPDYLYRTYSWNNVNNAISEDTVTTTRPKEPAEVEGTTTTYSTDGLVKTVTIIDATDWTQHVTTFVIYDRYEVTESEIIIYSNEGEIHRMDIPSPDLVYFVVYWHFDDEPLFTHTTISEADLSNPNISFNTAVFYDLSFFPLIPIRQDKVFMNGQTDTEDPPAWIIRALAAAGHDIGSVVKTPVVEPLTELNKHATRIMKLLKVDPETIIDAISTNDDLDKIDDVYLTFLADMYSKEEATIEYLMHFFTEHKNFINSESPNREVAFTSQDYSYRLSSKEIGVHNDLLATIPEAEVGKYSSFIDNTTMIYTYNKSTTRKNTVTVHKPRGLGHVRYTADNRTKSAKVELSSDPDKQSGLFVPISIHLAREKMSIWRRDRLYNDGMQLYINAIDKQHLEWFETEEFIFIAGAILIALSVGQLAPVVAGAVTAGVYATFILVLKFVIFSIVAEYVNEWIYEHIDSPILAQILSFIVTIALGEVVGITDIGSMGFADKLIFSVTKLSGVMEGYTQYEMAALYEEYGEFKAAYDKEMELIEDLNEDLGGIDGLTDYLAYSLFKEAKASGETPEEYYNRSLTANPGVVSLAMIEHFYDAALTLPK